MLARPRVRAAEPTRKGDVWGTPAGVSTLLSGGVDLREYLLGHVEGTIRRGHAAIDCRLQQHLLNLLARNFIVDGGAHVQPEFIATVKRDHHRQRQQAPRMPRQPWTRPNLAPCIPRNQLLKWLIKCVSVRHTF